MELGSGWSGYDGGVNIDHAREYDLLTAAAERPRELGLGDAKAAIQTGSGIPMPDLVDRKSLPWTELEGFPGSTAPGHSGVLHHGLLSGVPVLVLQGRLHLYEGHAPHEVIRPVRTVGLLGVPVLLLTNATGGVRVGLRAGDLVAIEDHLNLMGMDPLTGVHDPRFGERFTVLAGRTHDRELAAMAARAARDLGYELEYGIYAGVRGPTFETPAEVQHMRAIGAAVCGMSTVPEVIAAAQLGLRTLALSLVANPAGRVAPGESAEKEVLAVGAKSGKRLMDVVEGVVAGLAE